MTTAAATRSVIVHGHFYQPPREDPWLEDIPEQKGAAPWHDWNERIERECYRAVAAARVLDRDGRIVRVMNTLAYMSFDVGPTLFEWMERAAPATYTAILAADKESIARVGHGNAIAQPYHHVILPLASRRDKETEVRWGIADFERRFGRKPEGMWLPETAVDDETLDVLAQEGIAFTILAPNQVELIPRNGAMGVYTTSTGRSIAIGVYDGNLSHGVAFGRLLTSGRLWREELLAAFPVTASPSVVAIATDGETYGHHHHFSEMALAWLLDDLERTGAARVTNYGALLAEAPPTEEITLVEPSSWSCSHGVERWRSNCGCRVDASKPPHQEWRGSLRSALEQLRGSLDRQFADEAKLYFRDPMRARDDYGSVVAASATARDAAIDTHLHSGLTRQQQVRARELLEMARDGLRMFTSCAWFFDELTGLEPAQNLRYAARAVELAGTAGAAMERTLVDSLSLSRGLGSNATTADDIWVRDVKPIVPPAARLAAGAAAVASASGDAFVPGTPAFSIEMNGGTVALKNLRTHREWSFATSVVRRGVTDIIAFVTEKRPEPLPNGTIPVALAHFPERERNAVREAVRSEWRRQLAHSLLGQERLDRVAQGDISLVDAAVAALEMEIAAIGPGMEHVRADRLVHFIDLLELLDRKVPFDSQTAFARQLQALAPGVRRRFADAAARLGFAEGFMKGLDMSAAADGVGG